MRLDAAGRPTDPFAPSKRVLMGVPLGRQRRNIIYKPGRGLNDISVLSGSPDGRNFTWNGAVILANAGLIDGLQLRIGSEPCPMQRPIEAVPMGTAKAGSLNMLRYQVAFLTFWMVLAPSVFESVSADECLTTHRQLLEKRVNDRWKELHQKDNQPLSLTISAGQGSGLQFVGKKPDGSTWISGAMSICSYLGNKYQVKLDRIDKAPLLVALKLRGMSDTILAGSSHLKFGTGQHCGNPDPCIEFAPD